MRPCATVVFALAASSAVACCFISTAARAQTAPAPIGKIESLTGEIRIQHTTTVVVQASLGETGKIGDPVYLGDIVDTGANSKVGIAFSDGTAFNLSSNAHMVLDQYVYDPNGQSNQSVFSLSKGAFTFIAGKVARTGELKVNTPVATMGIRGTAPHVEISEDGTAKFSTLIEENKNAPAPNGPQPQRRAQRTAPQDPGQSRAEREIDKRLQICKGC